MGENNGLVIKAPDMLFCIGRRQAIIWPTAEVLLIVPLGINIS